MVKHGTNQIIQITNHLNPGQILVMAYDCPIFAVFSNRFDVLGALGDPVELWDTFKRETLQAAKECIGERRVIFTESLEVLVMALEALQEEAKPLGLEVSWLKTKVQVFGDLLDEAFTTAIQGYAMVCGYGIVGESRRSLEFQYRISRNLISSIIPEVCDALFEVLRGTYLKASYNIY
ncbi:hypothetical protein GWK47_040491 [Chionoecetes opilio]|uniref:Uncharacterized protein n=1 Tax=Chionoecetes opilio TaxID=41210 RepID=A0A8J5CXL9_CHIOP|nr:hypothetical protein GWK47_040491 [Chionoecetes opilio]